MSEFNEVPQPIICDAYAEPAHHWVIERGRPPEKAPQRREACYYYRPPRTVHGRNTGRRHRHPDPPRPGQRDPQAGQGVAPGCIPRRHGRDAGAPDLLEPGGPGTEALPLPARGRRDHHLPHGGSRADLRQGVVKAEGLVEAIRQGGFSTVYLEILGLDKQGHVVSRGFGRTFGGKLHRWESQPFVVSLRPTGKEDRFELKVWSYDWVRGGVG